MDTEKKTDESAQGIAGAWFGRLMGLAILGAIYVFSGIGTELAAQCQVDGTGQGACDFTNTGWSPGAQCVRVDLKNTRGQTASSPQICSGRVWPSDTTRRDVSIAMPAVHCASLTGLDPNACSLEVVNVDE